LNLALPLLLIWSIFFAASAAGTEIDVHFHAKASVAGPRIVLADIAKITPAGKKAETVGQLPVATAPPPGKTKELYVVPIITSMRNRPEAAEVDWQGSETILVERQGQVINQHQLEQIINNYLKENAAKLPKAELRLASFKAPEQLVLPVGELGWKVTPSRTDLLSSTSFSIQFTVDGKPAGNCLVRCKLEALAEVATATAPLRKGETITADMVTVQQQRIDNLRKPFQTKEELIGMQVARTVNAGQAIEQQDLAMPPVIKEGEMVDINAHKGSLNVTTKGLARADGRVGETIQVKNIGSNKVIHCRVDGPGTVSVEF
jgi:flagella basal body P-ring formation protein FlgA